MIVMGPDLLARRSELVALDIGNVTLGDDGTTTIIIKRSKTDREDKARSVCSDPAPQPPFVPGLPSEVPRTGRRQFS
jgi:hypothetical protein